jgi:hypothetical protein
MAVPGTIFGIKSDSIQKLLESTAGDPKLQALLLVALHFFADKSSSACAFTSSGTPLVYDPSTNSPPPKRPVRSKIGLFVAGKLTLDENAAGVNGYRFWQGRRANHKALREEGRRLAQELDVE